MSDRFFGVATRARALMLSALVMVAALAMSHASALAVPRTERISVSSSETQAGGGSYSPAISANGQYVAFDSPANNLVAGDDNAQTDIFVRDRVEGTTRRVSVSTAGTQGNAGSFAPSISSTGRFIAFHSDACTLVGADADSDGLCESGDTNNTKDVFVRDRDTDADGVYDEARAVRTTRVSVGTGGTQGNGYSYNPYITPDGRYVAFESDATNLVTGDTNGGRDIFLRDRSLGSTTRVSLGAAGTQANGGSYDSSITPNGRYIVFDSYATNLVAGDTNSKTDVFVRDRTLGRTVRMSVSTGGAQGTTESFAGYHRSISDSGRFVSFYSDSSTLVSGDADVCGSSPQLRNCYDVFVRDRDTDRDGVYDEAGAVRTTRMSISTSGVQASGDSLGAEISGGGRYVTFYSDARLVPTDANGKVDIFLRDRDTDADGVYDEARAVATSRPSVADGSAGTESNGNSYDPSLSSGGRYVAFRSNATNLVAGDTNGLTDTFVRDRDTP